MHLLITCDAVGGVWTYTQELVSGLARRGHRITLVSFGKLPAPHQTHWMRHLAGVDYHPTEYRLEWMEVAEKDIEESRRYLELLVREVEPDILHLSQYCYGDIEVDVPRIVVAHSDVVSWWVAVHGHEPDDTAWTRSYRERVRNGLRGADLVVAPSRWMLDAVAHYYLQPSEGVVFYNGRSPELFDPDQRKEDFVLSVGRIWDAGKNASLLLAGEQRSLICIVGWESEPGREQKLHPAWAENVQLLGAKPQPELCRLYASAGIYAATSCYEPFGLSPLEAAFSRCALVMNDIPVFHELWGDAALYFQKDDPVDLAQVIARLGRADLRCEFGERALRRAREKFTASRMVAQYEGAYRQVASVAGVT
jgi:glycosyltransferase involved in cell wall biosynthesis